MTEEDYEKMIAMMPEDRIRERSNDLIDDRILGILLAYGCRYNMRGGWVDIITLQDATREIKCLINSQHCK